MEDYIIWELKLILFFFQKMFWDGYYGKLASWFLTFIAVCRTMNVMIQSNAGFLRVFSNLCYKKHPVAICCVSSKAGGKVLMWKVLKKSVK